MNLQVIQIQSDLPIVWFSAGRHGKIQSDLPHPSLLKLGPIKKASFGLLAKSTGILADWVPTSLPYS